jgi:membrane protease YdiL (CAAX protease family)
MVPAIFFPIIAGKKKTQPMRLEVKLTKDTFALIAAALACAFAMSYANAIIMNLLSAPESTPLFTEASPYMEDYSIILQFVTMALVPAFCEEFLFRGVILSNLMPYGKATAVVISSVLFGLMHGNFYQFLYTVAGGIVIGTVYVLTDSIWCSIFIHLINNSVAVFQESMLSRLESDGANVVIVVLEGIIFSVGLIGLIYLLHKYRKPERKNKCVEIEEKYPSVFGKPLDADLPDDTIAEIPASEVLKLFFNPLITVFVLYSLFRAFVVLAM